MSRLNDLIEELCPNGVKYAELNAIAEYAKERIDASEIDATTYVGVDNLLPEKRGKTESSYVPSEGRLIHFRAGDILIGNIRPYLKKIWLADCAGGTNGDVLPIHITRDDVDPKYLYYCLSSDQFFLFDMQHAKGAKMPRGDKAAVMEYKVPIPPLEVQREIVRMLDNFTSLSAELSKKLSAELSARKKQYEYYLDYLLMNAQQTQVVKLKDICRFYNGDRGKNYPKVSEMVPEGVPFVNAGDVNGRVDYDGCNKITQEKYDSMGGAKLLPGDILYCLRGSTGKNGIYERTGGTVASSLVAIRANERVNYKYLYFLLNSSMEKRQRIRSDTGAAQPNLSAQNVGEFEFPLPSLQEQKRIVSILEKFEEKSSDMRIGIPAEIEARAKQYEYYRDKLLTFKEQT